MPALAQPPEPLVLALERRQIDSHPAEAAELADGWLHRFNHGLWNRVNSVYPLAPGAAPLADRIARAEAFYGARGLPARFQIAPVVDGEGLDAALAARGYARIQDSEVRFRPDLETAAAPSAGMAVELAPQPGPDWLALHLEAASPREAGLRRDLFSRLTQPRAFALARLAGVPLAIGLGILDLPILNISAMRTVEAARRRGLGRAIIGALMGWAQGEGGKSAFLQVEVDNSAARGLYDALGFAPLYGYHYRLGPAPAEMSTPARSASEVGA